MLPKVSTVPRIKSLIWLSEEISTTAVKTCTAGFIALSSADVPCRPSLLRSPRAKRVQPSLTNVCAVARPMPDAAPVIRATLGFVSRLAQDM